VVLATTVGGLCARFHLEEEGTHESHEDEDLWSQSKSCWAGNDGVAGRRGGVHWPGQPGCAFVEQPACGAIRPDHFVFADLRIQPGRRDLLRVERFEVLHLSRQHKDLGCDQPERP
jgi:hypothetical protein